ncbi:MAG: hypothetical protein B7Y11_09225 [Sphingobacteriia bacterium 24-36-13]|jgi:Cu(I)/Ag(I) efflux system membrane fusion protein|uniref:DUF3347 domain-containing protein n=1 Tax=Sediminibacterium sp. TaxID=1917865 RepID=UPI000BC87D17|nr:DUF3347 domain-containing protein [Sediminibacterium sp.]OYY09863.1 MAG: hypothetical protein B7Y66_07535 [Sphingobacteriia bacterium 35-36-14]OYZ53551.1 MAG: hypothetical protein B7Y11_09225 [Sphingobacteriia bacterium 24-36-13]OZA65790.1 MAG: hypothetical protein B7X68_02980 [Sphingobacteriia bacterium 39-36-14]HQS24741.1 DUF3347 domain-containing protein [Sediminibacterium sp.]HQS34375.1 DUF3347 domain-containing protein [Sediminibacterium sp.]
MKNFGLGLLLVLFAACGENLLKEEKVSIVYNTTRVSANSDVFNSQFSLFLNSYFNLKDAFIKEQINAIDAAADSVSKLSKAIPLKELKADSTQKTAQILIESIKAELIGLKGETDIEEKRKAFQMLGEQLLVLIQTVQYDRQIIYNQYCPMAMDNNGATWLSNKAEIQNPYLPKTMLECGEVKDTLNYFVK